MRLQEKNKRDMILRLRAGGADVPIWGPGTAIRAVIQPASSKILAEMYGERINKMKLLLYDGPETLKEGMGLCVDVAGDQPCDYRIISAEAWSGHQKAILEWIPAGRRA